MLPQKTEPVTEIQRIKGVAFPAFIRFRQLLITGPPGCGKSTLIRRIGGWSEEGYIDLGIARWWTAQSLSIRPREIHLGIPCTGFDRSLAVYDEEWVKSTPPPDLERIRIPPEKRFFFSVDWRKRYAFEFLLPAAQDIFAWRSQRARRGTHHVDTHITLALVEKQVETMQLVAHHLHRNGIPVYIRSGMDGGLLHYPGATG